MGPAWMSGAHGRKAAGTPVPEPTRSAAVGPQGGRARAAAVVRRGAPSGGGYREEMVAKGKAAPGEKAASTAAKRPAVGPAGSRARSASVRGYPNRAVVVSGRVGGGLFHFLVVHFACRMSQVACRMSHVACRMEARCADIRPALRISVEQAEVTQCKEAVEEKGGAATPMSLLWAWKPSGLALPRLKVCHDSSESNEEAKADYCHDMAAYCQRLEGGPVEDARLAGRGMKTEAKVGMRGTMCSCAHRSLSPLFCDWLQCFATHCRHADRVTGHGSLFSTMEARAAQTSRECRAACCTDPARRKEPCGKEGAEWKVRVHGSL